MLSLLASLALGQTIEDAETPPLDAQHFRPSIDGRHTLWTDDSARGTHKRLFLRPLVHYARQPLVYVYEDGSDVGILNNVLQADLMAGFAYDRVRVGIDLPLFLYADGDDKPSQSGLGDIDLDAKVTLLEADGGPGVAVNGRLGLPTSTLGDVLPLANGGPGWELAAIVDQQVGDILFAGNLGVRGSNAVELENISLNDFLLFRLAGAWLLDETSGVALEFAGDTPFAANTLEGMPFEVMLDGYTDVAPDLLIRGGLGTSITNGIAAPDYRVVLGFEWRPQPDTDADDDGIDDAVDACVNEPEDVDEEQDEDGCPEAIGSIVVVLVGPDGSPLPGGSTEIVDTDFVGGDQLSASLPAGSVVVRGSARGFLPGEITVDVVDEDVDREVVLKLEAVPTSTLKVRVEDVDGNPIPTAKIQIGSEKTTGASAEAEIPADERVPFTVMAEGYLETQKQYVKLAADGVEERVVTLEKARAELKGDRIDLRESVFFDLSKATIQERSHALLDQVVQILDGHPELTRLRIEGHTDSRGSASSNKRLSQARADAVKAFLVERGVAADRLEAVGFGEDKPLDPAQNEEAWAKNRRVDFFVAERSD